MKVKEKKKGTKLVKALIAAALATATIGACVACDPDTNNKQNSAPVVTPQDF